MLKLVGPKPKVPYKCLNCRDRNWLIECACGDCDKLVSIRDKFNRFRNYYERHKHRGIGCKRWKGGRRKNHGYWELYMPEYYRARKHGRVSEHVYFYEAYHKCCVLPWVDVHHIDKNKNNNMPWNLTTIIHGEHSKHHNKSKKWFKKDMSDRKCSICGSNKTWVDKKGHQHWYGNDVLGFICVKCHHNPRP